MARRTTGSSHILVGECTSLILVVPAHSVFLWIVGFPRGLFLVRYYTCFMSTHWVRMRHHNMSFHFYADDTQLYVSFKSSISGDLSRAPSTLEACARDINKWMLCNKIKLNDDKTEMLKHRPAPLLDQLQVATSSVTCSTSSNNIGVVLDSTLSLDKHVAQIFKSSFYSIRNISRIIKSPVSEDPRPRISYL